MQCRAARLHGDRLGLSRASSMSLRRIHTGPPNIMLERTAGSPSLAAAAQHGRWADDPELCGGYS